MLYSALSLTLDTVSMCSGCCFQQWNQTCICNTHSSLEVRPLLSKERNLLKWSNRYSDLPKLKIAKPSDTRWLAHGRCVKAVKASYGAIITALNDIHENTHQSEALGLEKALTKWHTVAAMYMLDYSTFLLRLLN